MSFFTSSQQGLRVVLLSVFFTICLLLSLFTFAQITLTYRMLSGYQLSADAAVNKGKATLFVFEQPDTFEQVFKPGTNPSAAPRSRQADRLANVQPNFSKEMVIGIALPSTTKPPRLSVSKVFVQDSVLTIRYIRVADSTTIKTPLATAIQPTLLVAIPAQTVLSTRLVENGKVVQTLRKRDGK